MSGSIVRETLTARNRRLLLAAWDRGVRVHSHWGGRYNVTSGTTAGKLYEVLIWIDGDENRVEECSCEWAGKQGPVITYNAGTAQAHSEGQPCSHLLVARWHRLPVARKAAILATDPELAAAWTERGQLAEVA